MFATTRWGSVLPDWRNDVCNALDFLINEEGGDRRTIGMERIGRARQESARGWYAVDVRGSRADTDQIDSMRLAGSEDPKSGDGYQVLEAVQDGSLIRVRVAEFVDLADAYLWQHKQPATHLIVKLREGIARLGDAGLAHDLAAGRLAAAPERPRPVAGFTVEQRQSLESCLGIGVRLVWGPPGTGKTRVLSEAIGELVRAGRRVLLVSATNIAVDNALLGVVDTRRYEPGVLVRVGAPHHPDMLKHPAICLPPLVRERLTTVEAERRTPAGRRSQVGRDHRPSPSSPSGQSTRPADPQGLPDRRHDARALQRRRLHRRTDRRGQRGRPHPACRPGPPVPVTGYMTQPRPARRREPTAFQRHTANMPQDCPCAATDTARSPFRAGSPDDPLTQPSGPAGKYAGVGPNGRPGSQLDPRSTIFG
jgi:hypothetical protein